MPIQIIILRHATAETKAKTRFDKDRELTEVGQNEAAQMGRQIRRILGEGVTVVTSPYARARQTAMHISSNLHEDSRLGAEQDYRRILDVIKEFGTEGDPVVIVSHLPNIDQVVCAVTGASSSGLAFHPGTAVFINIAYQGLNHGEIVGVLAPWMFTQT